MIEPTGWRVMSLMWAEIMVTKGKPFFSLKKKKGIMRKARFLSLPATLPQCTLCWREERNQHLLFILPELLDSKDVKFISVNVR